MTDITKLVDKWRSKCKNHVVNSAADVAYKECASDLKQGLHPWVQITEDESTWPDEEQKILVAEKRLPKCTNIFVFNRKYAYKFIDDSWRPLNDYDYPPKELK